MRLRRLGLSRYGLFTDRAIDFGERADGRPDLHVVYGPNEAGKSTALAGFLDLLFAFEHRSGYGFLHGYDSMRVEADLEITGAVRRFARIRKRHGSLLDGNGEPIAEGTIANALGGMNRETCKAMFSLDDDTLEAGGEEILRSEGDLGRLLFATAAGLTELSGTLERLRGEAARFHKGRARGTELATLKTRLAELDAERKQLDTAAAAFARLVEERDRAAAAYEEAAAARTARATKRDEAERLLRGLPVLAEIRRARAELEELGALPDAPETWFARIGELLDRQPRLTARIDENEKQRRRTAEERDALEVDDSILALAGRIERLDTARARYVTAAEDLPRRRASLAELDAETAAILRRLDRPGGADAEALVVPAAAATALHEPIERRSGIERRSKAADTELARATAEAERARRELEKLGGGDRKAAAFDRLANALRDAQEDDSPARLALHTRERRRLEAERDSRLERLQPWHGGAEALARVRTPEAGEPEAWRAALDEAKRKIERIEEEKARLESEGRRRAGEADAARAAAPVADDAEAARRRAARDKAWVRHRARLDAETADAFEARLRADDEAAAGRLAHAGALAGLRHAAEDRRANRADLERNARELALARESRDRALAAVADSACAMAETGAAGLPPDITLPRLAGWLDRRAEILEIEERIVRETADIESAREEAERRRARLAEALAAAAGAAHDPAQATDDLAAAARTALEADRRRLAALETARRQVERARAALEDREREAGEARAADSAWRAEWSAALARCWLGTLEPPPSPGAARRLLEESAALQATLAERRGMAGRIETMERDRAAYAAEVEALAASAETPFDSARAVEAGDALAARLRAAEQVRRRRGELAKKIAGIAETAAALESERAELRAVAGAMFEAFGVDSLREVDERLRRVRRRDDLRKALSAREVDLAKAMRTGSPEEAEAALGDADPGALEAEIAAIDSRRADESGRVQELFAARERAEDALRAVGGDDAAARLAAERRTVVLAIEDGARDCLRLRLGIEAAERALAAYRDAHRGSMMERASRAFRTISRGAYDRLETRPTDKGDILVGVAADGRAREAPQLSKGARFQLYLALRVAGYREFADRHGPVPFVADDILETFDDFRAEEAFRLFAEMAEWGQVIYLSHHRHLCNIARSVCPSVTVHELPGPTAAPPPAIPP